MKVCAILCLSLLRFTVHAGIARRDTTDDGNNYYVYSSRERCVSVNSAEPCPVTWKISPDASLRYSTESGLLWDDFLRFDNFEAGNECKESLKKAVCSQLTPRCLDEGRRLDYGDVNSTCQKIYDSCPKNLVDYKQQNFCTTLITGEHQRFKCVEAPKPIKGGCPQPKYKMTLPYLISYEKQSEDLHVTLRNLERFKHWYGARWFSSACLSGLKELSCTSLYCSADEKYFLTAYNRKECSNWIKKCFSVSYPTTYEKEITAFKTSYEAICKIYGAPSSASIHLPQFLLLIVSLFLKVFI